MVFSSLQELLEADDPLNYITTIRTTGQWLLLHVHTPPHPPRIARWVLKDGIKHFVTTAAEGQGGR